MHLRVYFHKMILKLFVRIKSHVQVIHVIYFNVTLIYFNIQKCSSCSVLVKETIVTIQYYCIY